MAEKRQRSPNFPSIPLNKALDYAKDLYKKDKLSFVNLEKLAYSHMDLLPTSNSRRIISAMLEYGILEDHGEGQAKEIRITELGRNIIIDTRPESIERIQNLRVAVLKSPQMLNAWKHWQQSLPAEDSIKYTLVSKWDFTARAASRFSSVIKDNYSFANLYDYSETKEYLENKGGEVDENFSEGVISESQTPKPGNKTNNSNEKWLDFSLSLGANQKAVLYVSNKLSDDDFEYLVNWVKRMGKDIIEDVVNDEELRDEDIPF